MVFEFVSFIGKFGNFGFVSKFVEFPLKFQFWILLLFGCFLGGLHPDPRWGCAAKPDWAQQSAYVSGCTCKGMISSMILTMANFLLCRNGVWFKRPGTISDLKSEEGTTPYKYVNKYCRHNVVYIEIIDERQHTESFYFGISFEIFFSFK